MKRIESIWYFWGERAKEKKKSCICKTSSVKFEKRNQSPNLRIYHVQTRDPGWPGSPEPPALDSSLKRSLFSKMIYSHMNSFLAGNVLLDVRRSPVIITVEGQQIVLNTKSSFLKQLGRKCNPLKLPVLVNRYHFLPMFTLRNVCTL